MDKPVADYDTTSHGPPERVWAQLVFAVYADYDANAPNSEDLIFCSTEDLAQKVCAVLNENPRKWGNLAFVEGWEWCKSYQYHRAYVDLDKKIPRSVADVMADVEEGDEEEEDEDSD